LHDYIETHGQQYIKFRTQLLPYTLLPLHSEQLQQHSTMSYKKIIIT
jgi:hypothetical protein